MQTITVNPFSERTIAQAIAVLRVACRTRNSVPRIVALVEGTSAEPDAWRKVAVDFLTAKADGRKVTISGNVINEEKQDAADYDFD